MSTSPAAQRAVTVTVRVGLLKVLGINLDVAGAIKLPRGRGYVLSHNLVSPIDAFVIALAMGEAGYQKPMVMLRGSMRSVPFLGPLLAAGALVFNDASEMDSFSLAEKAISEGHGLVTSPEAVISRSLEIGSMRSDPVRLATATDAPLVAAATFGAHRLFDENGRLRMRRGVPVNVTFGNAVPIDGSLNFGPGMRSLRMDMEALLSQTMNDYPGRDHAQGERWWPASLGGGAPTMIDAMDDPTQVSSPSAELWADDERVAASRSGLGGAVTDFATSEDIDAPLFLHDGPLGTATWSHIPPEDADPDALTIVGIGKISTQPVPEDQTWTADVGGDSEASSDNGLGPDERRLDPKPSKDVPIRFQTAKELHAKHPDVWEAPPGQAPPEDVRQLVHGVTGLLAFDMPGNPRQLMRKVSLSATAHDLYLVMGDNTVCLRDVEIDRSNDHSFFWGRLAADHTAISGDMRVNVPAGTRASFVASRRPAQPSTSQATESASAR